MDDVRIILSSLWVATMLTYLLGDVLRIFSGDFVAGEISSIKATQQMWMMAALLMLIPIIMVVFSMLAPNPLNRLVNIVATVLLFIVNIVGISGYPGLYDKFLIVVSLGFNVLVIWFAWNWV